VCTFTTPGMANHHVAPQMARNWDTPDYVYNQQMTRGNSLDFTTVEQIIYDAIAGVGSSSIPSDPNAIYFVLTAKNVSFTGDVDGMCTNWCAWAFPHWGKWRSQVRGGARPVGVPCLPGAGADDARSSERQRQRRRDAQRHDLPA
jgi:hypothetical protein